MALSESRSSESGWDLTPASYLTFRNHGVVAQWVEGGLQTCLGVR